MKSKHIDIVKTIAIVFAALQLLFILILFNWERRSSFDYPDQMPEDFNFKMEIGVGNMRIYKIDTFRNTFTSSLDHENDTTIEFQFLLIEKKKIYKIIKDIDVFIYPENYSPTTTIQILPSYSYYFESTLNGYTIKINWEENTYSDTKESKNLMKLFDVIFKNAMEDEKVKRLPESKISTL